MLNLTATVVPGVPLASMPNRAYPAPSDAEYAAVNDILVDCLFAVGQAVGMRKVIDYDAVQWWRSHFSEKFLRAMSLQGNRWEVDRDAVVSVAMLFGERAVRYAGEASSIDVAAIKQAAEDIERYCRTLEARRARVPANSGSDQPLRAGYWCTWPPPPSPPQGSK